MNTELSTPSYYKKVKMSLDQFSITRIAMTNYIKSLEEKEIFWLERLNGSNTPSEIKDNQKWLKMTRNQIADLQKMVKMMDKTELITEHKLY